LRLPQRTWHEGNGTLVPSHDPKLARALRGLSLERLPTLWDQFNALARIPLMVIRGANSDMLARSTLNEMLARRDQLEVVVVPDQGHAPLLGEPSAIRRVAAFVASCGAPRSTDKHRSSGHPHRVVDAKSERFSRRAARLFFAPNIPLPRGWA
jgi:pimeloyl-ACP methyl ester carboxylesterase